MEPPTDEPNTPTPARNKPVAPAPSPFPLPPDDPVREAWQRVSDWWAGREAAPSPRKITMPSTGWAGKVWAELCRRPILYWFLILSYICAVLIYFERDLILMIRFHVEADWRQFFNAVGKFGKPEQYIAICLIAIGAWAIDRYLDLWQSAREKLERFAGAAAYVIASILIGGAVLNVAKFVIGRLRPRALFNDGEYGFQMFNTDFGMNAFPSGHSQMAFSLAIALWFIYPKLRWLYVSLATFIACSRFLGTVHFPSDVIMGSFVGIVAAILVKRHIFDARGIEVRVR